jgi:REP element-mobilizing transposase RayT
MMVSPLSLLIILDNNNDTIMFIFEKSFFYATSIKLLTTRGYYVSTVGLDEAKVREYIKNQEIEGLANDKFEGPDPSDLF